MKTRIAAYRVGLYRLTTNLPALLITVLHLQVLQVYCIPESLFAVHEICHIVANHALELNYARKAFSQEMQEIKDETLLLSSMVEQAVMALQKL